jgi:tetratricopeptide (TPR) repeat protein
LPDHNTMTTRTTSSEKSYRLRITQTSEKENAYYVDIELEVNGLISKRATTSFTFSLSEQEQEALRWYFEDYLLYPFDPAPRIANSIEASLADMGVKLHQDLFESSDAAREIWTTLRERLSDTRVEIATAAREPAVIPWELIRDPQNGRALALQARAFVRTIIDAPPTQKATLDADSPIRILLVICRPIDTPSVPFRSVAISISSGLSGRADFRLDVLRPPTYVAMNVQLQSAKAEGHPYHIVHFDGHGTYEDLSQNSHFPLPNTLPKGKRGYLHFEGSRGETQYVSGAEIGKVLVVADVPLLALNACRSAYTETPATPGKILANAQSRSFGSLAQEVIAAGVSGVLAMRYNVSVVTAAQFVSDLYDSLTQGATLGEAATWSRARLAEAPQRALDYEPRPLQDWSVPLVYEATPFAIAPTRAKPAQPRALPPLTGFPEPPIPGFVGCDDTLLKLDQAFTNQRVVLLYGPAGSGKTATATEFAAWYTRTHGVEGPALFTSFERYTPLTQALDTVGRAFAQALEHRGARWSELNAAERYDEARRLLQDHPALWVWDSVETIAGFPSGVASDWSAAEQRELSEFLRLIAGTKAKILLTSRREETAWLGDLPERILMSNMQLDDFIPLAQKLTEAHKQPLRSVRDWWPILQFTRGNPLTSTALVEQALRDNLRSGEQMEAFIDRLRAGEDALNEIGGDRPRSIRASLNYGFDRGFNDSERGQLALLHFFQGWVNADALRMMGKRTAPWSLPALRDMTREACDDLLDRAADVGLLTHIKGKGGYVSDVPWRRQDLILEASGQYVAHPMLPWFFKPLFDAIYPERQVADPSIERADRKAATWAFVDAMGELGEAFHRGYTQGDPSAIRSLFAEEGNLLHARRLACAYSWWDPLVRVMQGLRSLYTHMGRPEDWARLVDEATPFLFDPATDGPLPGREEQWIVFSEYRAQLAAETGQWAEAERLQRLRLDLACRSVATALESPPKDLDDDQRDRIRTLAGAYSRLGNALREQGRLEEYLSCHKKAIRLYRLIKDRVAEASATFSLAAFYLHTGNLKAADRCYDRSLELRDKTDRLGISRVLSQQGYIAMVRLIQAQEASESREAWEVFYKTSSEKYKGALELQEKDKVGSVSDLAVTYGQLGNIHRIAGNADEALKHYPKAIKLFEEAGQAGKAVEVRFYIALTLQDKSRFAEALAYAREIQWALEQAGADPAGQEFQNTQNLINELTQQMKGESTT